MLVIRRKITFNQGYTVLMLPGGYYQEIPTSESEHAEMLKLYKQDKPYEDVFNDFKEYKLGTLSDENKDSKGKPGLRP